MGDLQDQTQNPHLPGNFTDYLDDVITKGYVTMGIGMGVEKGWFRAMIQLDRPASAADIARTAETNHRYTEEWLKWMVVAKIVTMDTMSESSTYMYSLPKEHREGLTSFTALFATHLPRLVSPHSKLMDAFSRQENTGLDTEDISGMLAAWETQRPEVSDKLVPLIVKDIKGMHQKLESGIHVCDIGTSRGHLLLGLARRYPNSSFTGLDLGHEIIAEARENASREGLENVTFVVGDAQSLPGEWEGRFDLCIMYCVLHHIPSPSTAAREFHRILAPGGVLSVMDNMAHSDPRRDVGKLSVNRNYAYSLYYCLSCSMSVPGSCALGDCAGVDTLAGIMRSAGFSDVTCSPVDGDANIAHLGYAHLQTVKK